MRKSGRILAETLTFIENKLIKPGFSTLEISQIAGSFIESRGGQSAFLGYSGFPAILCASVNSQVVHGIPTAGTVLQDGDIISIDAGVIFKGHFSDACRTFAVGEVPAQTQDLLVATKGALDDGIAAAVAGAHLSDISYAIQKHVERRRFRVSRDYTGHGIGRALHLPPLVPNFGPPGRGPILVVGSCLAIEPVVFDGPTDVTLSLDGWTTFSAAENLSAHFEDTIIIAEDGPEVITRLSS